MKKIVIAIDGYTWTGKWTTAKGVARILQYSYLDTWAMYRVAVLYAKRHWLMDSSLEEKVAMVEKLHITFRINEDTWLQETYMDWENVEKIIRATDHMDGMEKIITHIPVREALWALQKAYWKSWWIVADGRDMWTVVFPHAEVKVFLTCDMDVRVVRRVKQLKELWYDPDPEAIKKETVQRDCIDYTWKNAIWKKADDAIVIDTSYKTIDEQIADIVTLAQKYL